MNLFIQTNTEHNITHILKNKKVALAPAFGSYVYDTRQFTGEDGKEKTGRHIGHRVIEIKYADFYYLNIARIRYN